MKCDKCSKPIDSEEAREHNGWTLCEDCYMDNLSPTRTCDPWAFYTAKSTVESGGAGATLTATQEESRQAAAAQFFIRFAEYT